MPWMIRDQQGALVLKDEQRHELGNLYLIDLDQDSVVVDLIKLDH
jgi:hypothetical protein